MKLRLGMAVLVLVAAALAGCGGTVPAAEKHAALPLWQRVLQAGDLPGFAADRKPPTALDLNAFVEQAKPAFVRITPQGAVRELTTYGFRGAMITTQQIPEQQPFVASTVVELGSPPQAEKALDWAYTDSTSPCRHICNIDVETFEVPGIPGAKGVRRSREKDAGGTGPNDPFESFDVQFTDGPFLYDLISLGARPGEVSRDDVIAAAKALYQRVAGSPPLVG